MLPHMLNMSFFNAPYFDIRVLLLCFLREELTYPLDITWYLLLFFLSGSVRWLFWFLFGCVSSSFLAMWVMLKKLFVRFVLGAGMEYRNVKIDAEIYDKLVNILSRDEILSKLILFAPSKQRNDFARFVALLTYCLEDNECYAGILEPLSDFASRIVQSMVREKLRRRSSNLNKRINLEYGSEKEQKRSTDEEEKKTESVPTEKRSKKSTLRVAQKESKERPSVGNVSFTSSESEEDQEGSNNEESKELSSNIVQVSEFFRNLIRSVEEEEQERSEKEAEKDQEGSVVESKEEPKESTSVLSEESNEVNIVEEKKEQKETSYGSEERSNITSTGESVEEHGETIYKANMKPEEIGTKEKEEHKGSSTGVSSAEKKVKRRKKIKKKSGSVSGDKVGSGSSAETNAETGAGNGAGSIEASGDDIDLRKFRGTYQA